MKRLMLSAGLLALVSQAGASDRDTPAYMIYIDPVTGKYTTQDPNHRAPVSKTPRQDTSTSAIAIPADDPGEATASAPVTSAPAQAVQAGTSTNSLLLPLLGGGAIVLAGIIAYSLKRKHRA